MRFYDIYRMSPVGWILWDRVEAPSRRAATRSVPSLLKGRFKVDVAAQQASIKKEG